MFFGNRFRHEFEKGMFVCRPQDIIKFPVHFKLAIRVFVIILIWLPAQLKHVVTNLSNDIITAHHGLLIITWFFRCIEMIRYLITFGGQQKKFCLNAGFDMVAFGFGLIN